MMNHIPSDPRIGLNDDDNAEPVFVRKLATCDSCCSVIVRITAEED
jgi:hypothetical protein